VIVAVTMAEVKYVAAAYLVVFLFVLAYLLIHATKLARLEREVAELTERVRARADGEAAELTERVGARADG
jgi:CcmD family protein